MFRFILLATAAIVLAHAGAGHASADIVQYESLDLAVMRSDLVVRGQVIDVSAKKGDNGLYWHQVTVRVKETIKGKKLKELKFLVHGSTLESPRAAWQNREDDLLFCLNTAGRDRGGFDKADFVLHSDWVEWAVALNGTPGTWLPVYSVDFKALTAPKEILSAAYAAARDQARKPGAKLEWIVQAQGVMRAHAVLYPDSERVRAAGKKQGVELGRH